MAEIQRSDEQWREQLSEQEFYVCRQKGTERAFTGKYWDCKIPGIYHCACCDEPLFNSATKYDSGSGWPSFYAPLDPMGITTETDASYGMVRIEIQCSKCGCHLGHVFDDGPEPTGQRFCVNSASLRLKPE